MACCAPIKKDRYHIQPEWNDELPGEQLHNVVWKDSLGRMRVGTTMAPDDMPMAPKEMPRLTSKIPEDVSRAVSPVQTPMPDDKGIANQQPDETPWWQGIIYSKGPPSSRAGGYRPHKAELDPDGLQPGDRWSIRKLLIQLRDSVIIDALIFVVNESITAYSVAYWRPVAWSLAWIFVTLFVSSIGLFALRYRHTFGLVIFIVLQLTFSVINLQHLNMTHSEASRACRTPQVHFRNCDVPALQHCILEDKCTAEQMAGVEPACHAPGQAMCHTFATMEWVFWINQLINFFTYSEPCWWAFMLLLRIEITEQSEGENATAFRKILQRKLPPVQIQQGYNTASATILVFGALSVLFVTVILPGLSRL